jgi:hypothetical protein
MVMAAYLTKGLLSRRGALAPVPLPIPSCHLLGNLVDAARILESGLAGGGKPARCDKMRLSSLPESLSLALKPQAAPVCPLDDPERLG